MGDAPGTGPSGRHGKTFLVGVLVLALLAAAGWAAARAGLLTPLLARVGLTPPPGAVVAGGAASQPGVPLSGQVPQDATNAAAAVPAPDASPAAQDATTPAPDSAAVPAAPRNAADARVDLTRPEFHWTEWEGDDLDPGPGFKATGKIKTPTAVVTVTYSNPLGVGFYQAKEGTDFWMDQQHERNPLTSPYTSRPVPNIPPPFSLIALSHAGAQTLEFSQPIVTPVFAFVSLNGNGYAFDQDFDILSVGGEDGKACGYWGCGGVSKVVVNRGGALEYQLNSNNVGGDEPHGTIRFKGTFSKMTWRSSSDEYWNGFTVGVEGTAEEVSTPKGWVAVGTVASALSPRVELILDASGSMKEKRRTIDGKLKIDVAKAVLTDIVHQLPKGMDVALRVYGHRIREGQRGACQDSELVVPFGKMDLEQMAQRISAIRALGTTPIAFSLEQAAADFGTDAGERMVVLVTDGKEECGGDPLKAVQHLAAQGAKARLNVVGFALADEATKKDMRAVAEATGGGFFDAQDRSGLDRALGAAMGVPYRVVSADGRDVARGTLGDGGVVVPTGRYTVVVEASNPIRLEGVQVVPSRYTLVELARGAAGIGKRALEPLGETAARETLPSAFALAKQK